MPTYLNTALTVVVQKPLNAGATIEGAVRNALIKDLKCFVLKESENNREKEIP
jgi:hypothetical protein